jgi:type IV secretion system protein VirB9
MRTTAALFICSALAVGQTPPGSGPIQVKRVPAEKKSPAQSRSLVDQYDFGGQVSALEDAKQLGPAATPVKPLKAGTDKEEGSRSIVPLDFVPKADVYLTDTAREAVAMSAKWMAEPNPPSTGRDGRVLYAFGAGLPSVVCAPLRVCMIELQAGEKLVGEPQIGDSVRWHLSPAMFGTGETATPVIVLKPFNPGLDTNLLITTDRRAYYLRLLSKPDDYVARVAFAYPDDEDSQRQWREHLAKQKERDRKQTQIAELPANAVESMNFAYKVTGGDTTMRPVRVFDDGRKTYIQMSVEAQHREAPVLVVIGTDGKQEMVNYRVKESMYIVDRLFERAELVLGAGKKARKVKIDRERKG